MEDRLLQGALAAPRVGTLAWARASGGRLARRERLALVARGFGSQLGQLSDRAAFALGLRRDRLARLDLGAVRLPDTAAAREAERLADGFPRYMWHHSHRSYLWALALAGAESLRPDEELLYVACLMHDAGLVGVGERAPNDCFTLGGASAAASCAAAGGWPDGRRDRAMEAITIHVNPVVPAGHGVEASLLTRATTMDALALRGAWRLDPDTKRAVLARHPRHGIQRELPPALDAHAKEAPGCRIALYVRYGALKTLVRRSPWDG